MTLEPNPPIKRMRHVIKTYRDSKSPWIPIQAARTAYHLMGLDTEARHFSSFVEPFEDHLRGGWESGASGPPIGSTIDDLRGWVEQYAPVPEAEVPAMSEQQLVDHAWRVVDEDLAITLPDQHEHDFVLPWVARELGRLAKAARKGQATWTDYRDAEVALLGKAPAIAMWASHENADLSKTDLATALEAIQHFDAFEGEMPQGRVVYRFDDGYTIQELSDNELEAEGEAMQHCVGDYCLADTPGIHIYSLRDERGMPHVTMEYDGQSGHFVQIQGKQNDTPAPKYRRYIKEAIRKRFDGDPIGLLMIGEPVNKLDLTNREYNNIDFGSLMPDSSSLEGANFRGAEMLNCDFDYIYMPECDFTDAKLNGCTFNNTTLDYSEFSRAHLVGCDIENASCQDVSFIKSEMHGVSFRGSDLLNADFSGSHIVSRSIVFGANTTLQGADFQGVSIRVDNFEDPEAAMDEISNWPDALDDYKGYLEEGGVASRRDHG